MKSIIKTKTTDADADTDSDTDTDTDPDTDTDADPCEGVPVLDNLQTLNAMFSISGSNERIGQTFVLPLSTLRAVQFFIGEKGQEVGPHTVSLIHEETGLPLQTWTVSLPADNLYYLLCFPLDDTAVSPFDRYWIEIRPNGSITGSTKLGVIGTNADVYDDGDAWFHSGTQWYHLGTLVDIFWDVAFALY